MVNGRRLTFICDSITEQGVINDALVADGHVQYVDRLIDRLADGGRDPRRQSNRELQKTSWLLPHPHLFNRLLFRLRQLDLINKYLNNYQTKTYNKYPTYG